MRLAAGLTALAACAAFAAAPPPPIATRPAEKGCDWQVFSSAALGLEVSYQHCDFGYRTIDFRASKTALYQSMTDTGKKLDLSKAAFTISPDEAYAAKVAEKADTDIPPPPCGDYGMNFDSLTYFEFHAIENPRRFAFVSAARTRRCSTRR